MLHAFRSIRARLTFWYSFILLTTLIAFGLIAYAYSSEKLAENLDRSLSNEVKWVKNFIEPKATKVKPSKKYSAKKKPDLPPPDVVVQEEPVEDFSDADDEIWSRIYEHALINPKKTIIEVTDKKGAVIFRSISVSEESLMVGPILPDTFKIMTVENKKGEAMRVAAAMTDKLRIYAAYPLGELSDVLDNLFSIFLILIPIALAVSVGGGWFLANKSLKPVDDVTRTARQITAHNLDQQIPRRDVNDEIGRLIATFNEMISRLRLSFDQIKQFSIDASHELRTPLTIMRGEAELALQHPKSTEEYRGVLASNLEEIMRLSAIIDNLLTLSKADQGKAEIAFERIELSGLVAELHEDAEMLALKKKLRVRLGANEPLVIRGDQLRLRQLFLNLIDNAIKYTPEGGSVTLSSRGENGYAIIAVDDTGIGIPLGEQERIFDRFYRVDKARSRDRGGSGLGLSIAKWIAGVHKGTIEVTSQIEKGSTFSVRLPLDV